MFQTEYVFVTGEEMVNNGSHYFRNFRKIRCLFVGKISYFYYSNVVTIIYMKVCFYVGVTSDAYQLIFTLGKDA